MFSDHLVYLALGSNLGDRADNIHQALHAINEYAALETTSFLYETAAAYYTEQPSFLNAVCKATTHLSPTELLQAIEKTMEEMGRERTIPNGPRVIDIDILLYDELQFESPDLTIPHPAIAERDFVLEPLCDVAKTVRHPALNATFFDLWRKLGAANLKKVIPVGKKVLPWGSNQKSYLMGVLNNEDTLAINSADQAVSKAKKLVADGATFLDIDAHMTLPSQTPLPVDAEISRLTHIIEAVTSAVDTPISINTYKVQVAQAAVEAGAQWINYRCNLQHAEQICALVTSQSVPLVLTFNPKNNLCNGTRYHLSTTSAHEYTYAKDNFIEAVRHELRQMRIVVKTNVVPRWLIVQNPGLSLMNERQHVLQLIQNLNEIVRTGYPILVDPTRVRLHGQEKCEDEVIALSTLVAQQGASIVRTHNVKRVDNVLQITNALRTAGNEA